MAAFDRVPQIGAILAPATSINAASSDTAVAVGIEKTILLSIGAGFFNVLFGNSSVAAPDASHGIVFPVGLHKIHMGHVNTHLRVFNGGGAAASYSVTEVLNS